MTDRFNTALTSIFTGRQETFSDHLIQLLRQLYERGAADGSVPEVVPTLEAPHVDVGEAVATVGSLRLGDMFQNEYLRGIGQRRHVTDVEVEADGNIVLTTDLENEEDGSVILPSQRIDQRRLEQYESYQRVA